MRAAAVIVAVTVAAYVSSFAGVFVFDDGPAIESNPHVHSVWPLSYAMAAPPDTTVSGRPILSLSFALNDAVTPALWGFHAVNLAIHVLATLTLFGIVRRTLQTGVRHVSDTSQTLAACIALLWAVHPLQTSAVTYIVQRAESLMGLFYLLTLYCAIRGWTAAAIGACALGMATKESMVTAPLVVMAWDWVFAPQQMRRRVPLYLGLAATWTIAAMLVAGGYRSQSVGFGLRGWTAWSYLTTQAGVIAQYLRLAIVPWPLVLDYGWPRASSVGDVAIPAAIVSTLLALTVWAFVRRMPIGFAGVWFFLILAPTSSLIPIVTEVAADHRMYLPLAAVVAVGVWVVHTVAGRAFQARHDRGDTQRAALRGTTIVVAVVVFGVMTDARNRDYHSFDGIWLDTIEKRPRNARARVNYASALLEQHRYRDAEEHLRVAVDVDPDYPEAQADLGAALCAQQRLDEGIAHLRRAIAIQPDYAAAHQSLGEAYGSQGRLGPAAAEFARALTSRPDDVMLLNRTGWILATAKEDAVRNGRDAVALAERAVRLTRRRDVMSLDTLAAAYAEVDRFADAEAAGGAALSLARTGSDQAIIPELERRLALYRDHRKIRE